MCIRDRDSPIGKSVITKHKMDTAAVGNFINTIIKHIYTHLYKTRKKTISITNETNTQRKRTSKNKMNN